MDFSVISYLRHFCQKFFDLQSCRYSVINFLGYSVWFPESFDKRNVDNARIWNLLGNRLSLLWHGNSIAILYWRLLHKFWESSSRNSQEIVGGGVIKLSASFLMLHLIRGIFPVSVFTGAGWKPGNDGIVLSTHSSNGLLFISRKYLPFSMERISRKIISFIPKTISAWLWNERRQKEEQK